MRRHRRTHLLRRRAVALLAGTVCALAGTLALGVGTPAQARDGDAELYLVTLRGPGTAGAAGFLPSALQAVRLRAAQDATLADLGAPEPTYRWTTALSGYAVELTTDQADLLRSLPDVTMVEPNSIRPLSGALDAAKAVDRSAPQRGGAGVVIGLVDTGLAPESPLFAQVRHRGPTSRFSGACIAGQDWDTSDCNGKVVGARWFVRGFGTDHVRAASKLSARDTDGHGTAMASIAAGDAGVKVRIGTESFGTFGGHAPEAQLSIYKACWSAPDPADDGCATADLVAAIDQATADGVDVLSLSVGGPGEFDTVERALLGAAEAGTVVTAAAGNTGDGSYVAHPGPWVTTVGGTTGDLRRGRVVLPAGRRIEGAMLSRRTVGPARVVLAGSVPAAGASTADAAVCAPGSLDAARVEGAIVVCTRGVVGRVDKSEAVHLADGVGMVLVNAGRGSVDADAHRVPTVHLSRAEGRGLVRWVEQHPGDQITLESAGVARGPVGVAPYSPSGDPEGGVLKPDVLAPATGVLGGVPTGSGSGWDFVTGTSAATAYTAGVAATLLSRRDWTAAEVRSAIATTATPVGTGASLDTGSGRVQPEAAAAAGLGYLVDPRDYRAWLEGDATTLNTPSALLGGTVRTFERTVTNLGRRRDTFTVAAQGFRAGVQVEPSTVRLAPGKSATYTVTVRPRGSRIDDGYVVWRGERGSVTRIPVVLAR